jgi:serine protease Do
MRPLFAQQPRAIGILALPVLLSLSLASAGCQRTAQAAPTPTAAAQPASPSPLAQVPAPFATPPILAGTPDIATLVAKVKPAVVNITAIHDVKQSRVGGFGEMDPFGGAIPFGRGGREGGTLHQRALGTGFIIDPAGKIATNAHVVEDADRVRVKLADEREFNAKVIGRDARLDLAVLQLEGAKDLPVASLGSSEALRVGEYAVAIGNPFGLSHTVTMGIVSAKGRAIGASQYDDFIQTDASINPGNSGGPLFNLQGQVIGINTAINPQGRGIGFAIPVDAFKDVLPQLLTTGTVARGRLGVHIQGIDAPLAKTLGLDKPTGALVGELETGGPGERAGLKAGDVILEVDKDVIDDAQELPRVVAKHAPGSKVSVKVLRNKTPQTMSVTLDALKDDTAQAVPASGSDKRSPVPGGYGLELGDARGGGARVERVLPGGAADESLAPGDVILEVNRQSVATTAEAVKALQGAPQGAVLLKVRRNGQARFVAVERK